MYISKTKISYPISLITDSSIINRFMSIDASESYEDRDYIDLQIQSATELTEGQINQDIAYTRNSVTLKDFTGSKLVIPQGNLNSVTNIINNDTSTAITSYTINDKSYAFFEIEFDPEIRSESLTINFTTGWSNLSDVPKTLKLAILSKTLGAYNHTDKYDFVWETYCNQYKLI